MAAIQHRESDWEKVWEQIDSHLTSMIEQVSRRIENLYVEKGNFKTRDCTINAYLVLANPAYGDVAQMEDSDMVNVSIVFCNRDEEIHVLATLSKGIVISSFHQSLPPMQYPDADTLVRMQNVLTKINSFVDQNYEDVYRLLL